MGDGSSFRSSSTVSAFKSHRSIRSLGGMGRAYSGRMFIGCVACSSSFSFPVRIVSGMNTVRTPPPSLRIRLKRNGKLGFFGYRLFFHQSGESRGRGVRVTRFFQAFLRTRRSAVPEGREPEAVAHRSSRAGRGAEGVESTYFPAGEILSVFCDPTPLSVQLR